MKMSSTRKLLTFIAVLALIAGAGIIFAKKGNGGLDRKHVLVSTPMPVKRPVNVVVQTTVPRTVRESFTLPEIGRASCRERV